VDGSNWLEVAEASPYLAALGDAIISLLRGAGAREE